MNVCLGFRPSRRIRAAPLEFTDGDVEPNVRSPSCLRAFVPSCPSNTCEVCSIGVHPRLPSRAQRPRSCRAAGRRQAPVRLRAAGLARQAHRQRHHDRAQHRTGQPGRRLAEGHVPWLRPAGRPEPAAPLQPRADGRRRLGGVGCPDVRCLQPGTCRAARQRTSDRPAQGRQEGGLRQTGLHRASGLVPFRAVDARAAWWAVVPGRCRGRGSHRVRDLLDRDSRPRSR